MSIEYRCKSCNAQRTIELPCEPDQAEDYASFLRCPVCFRVDRAIQIFYWVVLAIKAVLVAGLLALVPLLSSRFFWIFPPLGVAAVWADHRRFVSRLDLVVMAAVVKGGPPRERLPRPFA